MIYLDNAATTPIDERVLAAMLPCLTSESGNPSALHRAGQRAAEALERARGAVARVVGARNRDVVFTSGGTEANALGVLGAARARRRRGRHVLVGPTEHACVRESAAMLAQEGFEVEELALDARGELDLARAAAQMRRETIVVAQMLVQNEVGSIYPVRDLARLARSRSRDAHIHVDAVQALGKVEISLPELACDSLAICAHKLHGPQGAGALVLAASQPLAPLWAGGGQEHGLRAGTENVAAIVGFGVAAEIAESEREASSQRARAAREALEQGVAAIRGARVISAGPQVPHIVAIMVPNIDAEVVAHHLDRRGITVGIGAACAARNAEPSPALLALGLAPDQARRVVRVSFSRTSTVEDARLCAAALVDVWHGLVHARSEA